MIFVFVLTENQIKFPQSIDLGSDWTRFDFTSVFSLKIPFDFPNSTISILVKNNPKWIVIHLIICTHIFSHEIKLLFFSV